ncbi:MAG: cadmium-translocating P-type ATPase [Paludibacterium sp.]|uniref:heavy metal translocating P-type ATPase n=1 Tax=Paludibacterium sp. TaxID=1917523 RepID=UPI0025EBF62F|nr:heavy metal translocating P-type ATPase [Paludibacterium sp.]MBV8046328.1 cadmium-translocating P-type ATPase [Paludibacterium sp.]MBV8649556.1 cadmium-translocating P-type ATPase [Paludibacterium sp.]
MTEQCFHCGLPVPPDTHFIIREAEREHAACCAGCQAVAQTILDTGLGDYYRHREASGQPAEALPVEVMQQIALYDNEALQQSFVRAEPDNVREATLMLEGITCAACVWLVEQQLLRLPGALSVDINYTSHRARVRWDNAKLHLSRILEAVARVGYRAHPYDSARQEALQQKERKQAINRLWVAGLSMMQVMMYAVPIYVAKSGEIEPRFLWILHWASFLLTLPVMLYSAQPFYRGAWRDLRARRVGMDTPVALGILTAFGASSWALLHHIAQGVYFDSVSMFVFLLLGGRYLEGMARRKAGEALESLVKLIPAFAHHLADWPVTRHTEEVAVSTLQTGMTLLVRPGETIPVDGVVVDGISASNEALLTGESHPVDKLAGSAVIAGSVNLTSPLVVRVGEVGQNTRLAAIARLLDQALAQKPRLAVLADRFASLFVAGLLLTAALSFVAWEFIDPTRALWIMVAVLVITCPCALSLATPAALTAASGRLARMGVLVARGHALEALVATSDVVFDKTGTLTDGNMRLLAMQTLRPSLDDTASLALARQLEAGSEHPLARALLADADVPPQAAAALRNHPGRGVEGTIAGETWRLGQAEFVGELAGAAPPQDAWQDGSSLIWLGGRQGFAARFAIGDTPRGDAQDTIDALRRQGLRIHLLSGDGDGAVKRLAQLLDIAHWRAGATPQDKLDYVAQLQAGGGRVLMIGDGINDAPVLARADVSIAMGGGTDVARASGDMVLIDDSLSLVPEAWLVARKTRRIIQQNLWWAAAYNLVALPLAVSGHVTPWLASLGMATSSLLVVSNALRLIERRA